MRTCHKCGRDDLPDESFGQTSSGYLRRVCYTCRDKQRKNAPERSRRKSRERRQRDPARWTLYDCRASDKKHGRGEPDLDYDFVWKAIDAGCFYCGDTTIRVSLDRLDNSKRHDKSNVVPCCIRCNYLRGNMPYAAWIRIAKAVREVREEGLFGDWRAEPFNRKKQLR